MGCLDSNKEWDGKGIPPTGTVCELRTKTGGWGEAEIKYQGNRGVCVWLWVRHDGNSEQIEFAESPDKLEFRQILTPEQVAAFERENAINEMTAKYWRHSELLKSWAEYVYDQLGYRRP